MSRYFLLSILFITGFLFLITATIHAAFFPIPPATKGTIGLYHFEGDAVDATGQGNDGSIQSAAFTAGQQWQGLEFKTNEAVIVPIKPGFEITDQFTFEAWIYQTSRRHIAVKIFETTNGELSLTTGGGGTLQFSYLPANGKKQSLSSIGDYGAIYTNRWQQIAVTIGNGIMAIYIDGHEANRKTIPPELLTIKTPTGNFIIGNDASIKTGFIGKMDEVRISRDVSPTLLPLDVLLTSYPSKKSVTVEANIIGLRKDDAEVLSSAELLDKEGLSLQKISLSPFRQGIAKGEFETNNLEPGNYPVAVQVRDASTYQTLANKIITFRKLSDTPSWKGMIDSLTLHVPAPWTSPQVSGTNLSCWGREYRYGESSAFPAEIINQNESILSSSIRMVGNVNGQSIQWNQGKHTVTNKTETAVTLESETQSQNMSLKSVTTFEYDGFMKIAVTINPLSSINVESLSFEIPLKKEFAKYFHYCPDAWTFEVRNAGALPADGWGNYFKPYLWLGNEEIGLAWCCESYRGWSIDKNKTAVEARPEGDAVILRASIVNRPVKMEQPITVVFGLQATPAKPRPAGSRKWRYGNGPGVTVGIKWADPEYGVWYHFPTPRDPKKYNEMIEKDFHSKGQMFTMYSDYYYPSAQTPEFQYYKGDWWVTSDCWAQTDVIYYGQPCLSVCFREKTWMDYHISLFIDYFKNTIADGTYMDGVVPITCQNPTHEQCYFINQDGERDYEYQIFSCREMLKAIYCVSRQYNPPKIVVSHMSTRMISPILTFTDAYVDGEQFIAGERFTGDYIASAPLDKIIAEFMGRQYGIVQFFLPEFTSAQATEPNIRNLLTLLLLHDMSIWWGATEGDIVNKTWKVLDDFKIEEAEFAPYWKSKSQVNITGENILVSAYYRQGKELLLVVGNLGSKTTTSYITGDPGQFGISTDGISITDGFTGQSILIDGESISVEVPAKDFRLIRVKNM